MKKTLVLIRHAKSDWGTLGQPDFERSLNDRGKRDAPEMGRRLGKRQVLPDLILSSPANRAATTAKLIAEQVGYSTNDIVWDQDLYHCPAERFDDLIVKHCMGKDVNTVFVFSHNPGITYYANNALQISSIDNIPTCGMVALVFNLDSWSDYPATDKQLLFFDYPKNI